MHFSTRHRVALVILMVVVLILIFLGIFLALGKMKRSREASGVIPPPPDPNRPHHPSSVSIFKGLLANTIDHTVLLLDLENCYYNLMVDVYPYGITAFDYYLNESVYYGTTKSIEPIKSTTERNEEFMKKSRCWTKTALAVDFVTQKVYVIDGETEQLNLIDFRGDHLAILVTNLNQPKDVVLDLRRSLMFVLQASSILQANMDGTEVKTILEDPDLTAITLDYDNARIYYSSSCAIKSVDYIDDWISPVLITMTDDEVLSLAVLDNQLYFVGIFEESGRRSLTSCSIVGNTCKDFQHNVIYSWLASKLQSIKAYDNRKLVPRNPCEWMNAECEHLCVLTNSPRSYTCICSTGYRLNSDQKTCTRIKNYLLYVEDNKIKRSVLEPGEQSLRAVDSSTLIDASALKMKKLINFDYSFDGNFLVYTDYSNVHYVDLINGTTWMIKGRVDCGLIPAVDWLSNNLYYARNCQSQNSQLMVRSVSEASASFESDNFLVKFSGHVGALVVHPFRNMIFFTQYSKEFGKYLLHAIHTNGSKYNFGRNIATYETGLCIDYVDGRLYWLSEDAKKIFYANFDVFEPKAVDIPIISNPRTISAFNDWLYISNLTEIWRVNKETGGDAARAVPVSTGKLKVIHDAKVFRRVLQPIDKHHRQGEISDIDLKLIKR